MQQRFARLVDFLGLQLNHTAVTAEIAIRQNALDVFHVDTCAIHLRAVGRSHLLNICSTDLAAVNGVAFNADAEKLRNFLCHVNGSGCGGWVRS
ncbi:hypothetical protein D3C80_1977430 [compost metagenome]